MLTKAAGDDRDRRVEMISNWMTVGFTVLAAVSFVHLAYLAHENIKTFFFSLPPYLDESFICSPCIFRPTCIRLSVPVSRESDSS